MLGEDGAASVRPDRLASLATPAHAPSTGSGSAWPPLTAARCWPRRVVGGRLASAAVMAPPRWPCRCDAAGALQGHVREAEQGGGGARPRPRDGGGGARAVRAGAAGSPLLARLHEDLVTGGRRPSQTVRALRVWWICSTPGATSSSHPWPCSRCGSVHCALAIEALAGAARRAPSRRGWRPSGSWRPCARWRASPGSTRPTSIPIWTRPRRSFEAEALGHPLIPRSPLRAQRRGARRRHAGADRQRLEHVGQEHAAALRGRQRRAGAGGRAGAGARAPPVARCPLGATLRIQDSLQEGTSRFYAELVRLRDLVRIADGPIPLLFLLDEILHGTNSHDRRLGAAAVVRGLVRARAPSASSPPTTWRCPRSPDDPAIRAANVHFEDRLEDGQMVFDYRMRPGVVRTSNALALMRALGLLRDDPSP